MMKYLKAEAEIIKFDNSDVVTDSYTVDDCGAPAAAEFEEGGCYWPGFWAWIWNCLVGISWWFGRPESSSMNLTDDTVTGDVGQKADW